MSRSKVGFVAIVAAALLQWFDRIASRRTELSIAEPADLRSRFSLATSS